MLGAAEPEVARRQLGHDVTALPLGEARMWLRHCDIAHRFRSRDVVGVRSLEPISHCRQSTSNRLCGLACQLPLSQRLATLRSNPPFLASQPSGGDGRDA
jgi:hypothetical protein